MHFDCPPNLLEKNDQHSHAVRLSESPLPTKAFLQRQIILGSKGSFPSTLCFYPYLAFLLDFLPLREKSGSTFRDIASLTLELSAGHLLTPPRLLSF